MTKIAEAIELLGGPAKAAGLLGKSVQAWCFYRDGDRRMPMDLCAQVSLTLDGAIKPWEIDADYDWASVQRALGDAAVPGQGAQA